MGYYINRDSKGNSLPDKGKIDLLLADGAKIVGWQFSDQDFEGLRGFFPEPRRLPTFQENLVVVVQNPRFEAAGHAHSPEEFAYMSAMGEHDQRPRVWLKYDHAAELSGYAADH
jgi:hypothetical protein